MRWPADHPCVVDPDLAPWAAGADELCPAAEVGVVLRHLAGRRVATMVTTDGGSAVLKVVARPRARGNHRRMQVLAASPAGALIPPSYGADRSGHVSLVGWLPGLVLDQLPDTDFVHAARRAGEALAVLHGSGAVLDRQWTVAEEVDLLRKRETMATRPAVETATLAAVELSASPLVPSHRDFHPRQVVWDGVEPRWIDLDDAAMAPAGLDVGNMVAHLRRDAALGLRSPSATHAAIAGFLCGYGAAPAGLAVWEQLSLVRLAGLAETRHGQPQHRDALLAAAALAAPLRVAEHAELAVVV